MSEIPTTDLDSAHQALDHMLVSVREHAWPNVPSVTAALRRSKLVVLVDELGRIVGLVVGSHRRSPCRRRAPPDAVPAPPASR